MNTDNINPLMGNIINAHTPKENVEPQMIRIQPTLKQAIQKSADKHNEGNFNKECRDLIRIGLKNRKSEGKK